MKLAIHVHNQKPGVDGISESPSKNLIIPPEQSYHIIAEDPICEAPGFTLFNV